MDWRSFIYKWNLRSEFSVFLHILSYSFLLFRYFLEKISLFAEGEVKNIHPFRCNSIHICEFCDRSKRRSECESWWKCKSCIDRSEWSNFGESGRFFLQRRRKLFWYKDLWDEHDFLAGKHRFKKPFTEYGIGIIHFQSSDGKGLRREENYGNWKQSSKFSGIIDTFTIFIIWSRTDQEQQGLQELW